MTASPPTREFDLILLGATGVTGSNAAEYLARVHGLNSGLKWAIAGRSLSKLEAVKERCLAANPSMETVKIVTISDTMNADLIEDFVKKTAVVLSTVGPFERYGEPLVAACVKHKTHYVDSTGETPFVARMIEKYHKQAAANGVFIVPCCGFDCIPSDLGAFLVAQHFSKQHNVKTKSIHLSVALMGSVSGGTIQSVFDIVTLPMKELKKLQDSDILVDKTDITLSLPSVAKPVFLTYNKIVKKWQSYFFFEGANTKYVRRSLSLYKGRYGPDFKYTEAIQHKWLISAILANLATVGVILLLLLPPVRWLVEKILPAGAGPTSPEALEKGMLRASFIGISEGETPKIAIATIDGDKDPGYALTAHMLVESALCLVFEKAKLNATGVHGNAFENVDTIKGGVLTGASAFGMVLVDRLNKYGEMRLAVKDLAQ